MTRRRFAARVGTLQDGRDLVNPSRTAPPAVRVSAATQFSRRFQPPSPTNRSGMMALARLAGSIAVVLAAAGPAAATNAPEEVPRGSWAATVRALRMASMLPVGTATRTASSEALVACRPAAGNGEGTTVPRGCRDQVAHVLDAIATDGDSGDRTTRGLARVARPFVSEALFLLSAAEARSAGPRSGIDVAVALSPDGRTLRVRPTTPLRGGRDYGLVVSGLPADVASGWHVGVASEASAALRAEQASRVPATLDEEREGERRQGAISLVDRIARDVGGGDAPPSVDLRAALRRPLESREIVSLRVNLVEGSAAANPDVALRFRTQDVRGVLARERAAVDPLPCASATRLQAIDSPASDAALEGVYRGRFPSPGDGADTTEVSWRHSFLIALPRGASATTPIVLAVHGHGGSAAEMLRAMAPRLARRGMATLAIDLPAHGGRAGEGARVDALDPVRSAHAVRRAALDTVAAVGMVTRCGLVLPDGTRLAPAGLRFLGYSLGAAVGILARAIEPRIETTALIAPAADLVEWQVQQVPKLLGAQTYTICSGGPAHGAVCGTPDACGPQGACIFDPSVLLLMDVLALPYRVALAPADPLAFAAHRTGGSTAPLLILAGALDMTVGTLTARRLADAYGWNVDTRGVRRGRTHRLEVSSASGHELFTDPRVREQAADFLADGGRRRNAQPTPATP